MDKIYRVVIDHDLNNFDPADYDQYVTNCINSPYNRDAKIFEEWANGQIGSAEYFSKAGKAYKSARAAKAQLTRGLRNSPCKGWIEEGEVTWTRM